MSCECDRGDGTSCGKIVGLDAGQATQPGTHGFIYRLCQLLPPAPFQQAHLGGDLG